jgi:hypothetical protein
MPRHAIRRQIVEVTVPDQATARRVTPLVSALIEDRVSPVLERIFDAAAAPEETLRIDRLELDLGYLELGSLAEQLPARIAAALPAALRRAVTAEPGRRNASGDHAAASRPAAPEAAALMLIGQFARTGGLPWWSDARQRRLLDEAVTTAQRAAPTALARILRALGDDAAALERLIAHLSDESLGRLGTVLAPGSEVLAKMLDALLERTPALIALTPARRRRLLWQAYLKAAAAGGGPGLAEAMLTGIAAAARTTFALLLDDLRSVLPTVVADARVAQQIVALAARHPPPAAPGEGADLERLLELLARHPDLASLLARLRPLASRLAAAGRADFATALARLAQARAVDAAPMLHPPELAALLRPFLSAGLIAPPELRDVLAPVARAEAEAAIPTEPAPPLEGEESRAVATAGLCLLWPFVTRFFARLGLLDETEATFRTPAAMHRGVLLLHHLATGEVDAPDYALDLPKVLCGLPPQAPHHPLAPVSEDEAAEADRLLQAAIAHAACLGEMSPDGLRGTFLARAGILGTRDGSWLLRVERQPADILIERFPWRTDWVRLPWMQAPMRVEW